MLTIDSVAKTLFKADSVSKSYTISIYNTAETLLPSDTLYPSDTLFPLAGGEPDIVISNDKLVSESVNIKSSICDSGDIVFGKCNSSVLTFQCADIVGLDRGKELLVTMSITGYETPVPIGSFIIDSIKKSADRRFRTVTAYDRMSLFDKDVAAWYNNLWESAASYSIADFRASLCAYVGVPVTATTLINDSLTITHTITPSEISGREILEAICEINGVFGIVDANGYLKFISLNDDTAVETITVGMRKSLEYEDYKTDYISALVIRQEDNDIGASVGSGTNAYIIQGNFLVFGKTAAQLTAIATTIFNAVSGFQYVPMQLACKGLPYIEPGDCIDIYLANSTAIRTFVMNRSLSGIQGLTDGISATGSKTHEETFGVNKSVIQLKGKSNILERTVEGTVSRVVDLEGGYTEIVQNFDNITFSVDSPAGERYATLTLKTTNDSTGEITLASANITIAGAVKFTDLSTAGETTINGSNITTGIIKSANYDSSGGDSGTMINLSTGEITASNFRVSSAGQLFCQSAFIEGNITATSGVIGTEDAPWLIGGNSSRAWIYTGKSSMTAYSTPGVYLGTDGIAIGAGTAVAHKFAVSSAGILNCVDATVAGTINATSGIIGTAAMPWYIGGDATRAFISSGKSSFDDDSTTGIYIGTNGLSIGGAVNGNIKMSRSGVMSAQQITVANRIYIGDANNYIYYENGTLKLWCYNHFYVNNTLIV